MREDAVDDKRIEGDYDSRDERTDDESSTDGNPLMDCVRVLESVVLERKVLVEGFDGVECVEDDDEDAVVQG